MIAALSRLVVPAHLLATLLGLLGGVAALGFGAVVESWPAVAAGAFSLWISAQSARAFLGVANTAAATGSLERIAMLTSELRQRGAGAAN